MQKKDKEIDKILEKYNKDIKRHIDVLKEDFDSKAQLIAEQYDSIRKKLSDHDTQFTSLENKLNSHTEMIASMKESIEIMKIDINFIKGSLKQKVDVEEFNALEKRVILLEAKINKK